jgi:uncharacterized protein YbjT (DUF2867 family)
MKNILLAGANGMIGGLILKACLERDDVRRVTSIVRKKSGMAHAKLNEIIHEDFYDFAETAEQFADQDICFFCVGVYTGQVPREIFRRITVDITVAFATALKKKSPQAAFCFLSGQGADRTEKSRVMFAKYKGMAENILVSLGFPHLYIFRPGYIYPVTPRKEPNLMYSIFRVLYKPLVSWMFPQMSITSERLAQAMVNVAFEGSNSRTFENREIRALVP